MKFLNFGSLNLDNVYSVSHFVSAGETLAAEKLEHFCGGKGLNQSIALARAGAPVYHAGRVGTDGGRLTDLLKVDGVDVSGVAIDPEVPTGHAIIQVVPEGQNDILLFGGANRCIDPTDVKTTLEQYRQGDWLLVQNEISALPLILRTAHARGMTTVVNPSPIDKALLDMPELKTVDWFILNEVEGEAFTGESEPDRILDGLTAAYPQAQIVLTLGTRGAVFCGGGRRCVQPAIKVQAVDSTAAGDTFTGFFFAATARGMQPEEALLLATRASARSVTVKGAANSIPFLRDLI